MSNLSSFVLRNTVDTATVTSSNVDVYVNGGLCLRVSDTASLGEYCEGGHIICKSSNTAWIVSPRCSEVSRTWYLREDANTLAQSCTSCTGWFIPTCAQLQNPGYTCRTYWDSFSSACYWSSTEFNATLAWCVNFNLGTATNDFKTISYCVRAFRCVTY